MIREYESVLRIRFPTVVIRTGLSGPTCGDRLIFDVFFIPDERGREFMKFVREELPALLEARKLRAAVLVPHGEAATREYYPELSPRRSRRAAPAKRLRSRRATPARS